MIPDELLEKYGAQIVRLKKGEILFEQGMAAIHFYMVRDGKIKMTNYNDEGREFVQGYFTAGQSFGEPPFFNHLSYPASAIAVTESSVWKIGYEPFLSLLRDNFDVHLRLTEVLSGRLIYKSMMLSEIAVEEADHRLAALMDYFRKNDEIPDGEDYRVPFTRQQLADLTGLRVETVIRSIKSMEGKGKLRIDEGRVYWRGPFREHSDEEW